MNGAAQATLSGPNWSTTVNLVNGVGLYSIEAVAKDVSSNKTATAVVPVVLVDLATPLVALASPAGDMVTSSSILSITGSATAASVTATLNGVAVPVSFQPATGGYTLVAAFPAEGVYSLLIAATDAFGNSSSVFRTLIYDATSPALTIISQSATGISGRGKLGATVYVKDVKGVTAGTVVVQKDGTWNIALTGSEVMPLNVYALDAAGNSSRNGDIDGSGGAVDIADALKAMRIAVKLDPLPTANSQEFLRGDVAPLLNGVAMPDGKIDMDDVLVILMKVAGLLK